MHDDDIPSVRARDVYVGGRVNSFIKISRQKNAAGALFIRLYRRSSFQKAIHMDFHMQRHFRHSRGPHHSRKGIQPRNHYQDHPSIKKTDVTG